MASEHIDTIMYPMGLWGAVRHIISDEDINALHLFKFVRTQNAHMPQHIAPKGFRSLHASQLLSRRSRLGFTDISRIQGMGWRKLLLSSTSVTPHHSH